MQLPRIEIRSIRVLCVSYQKRKNAGQEKWLDDRDVSPLVT